MTTGHEDKERAELKSAGKQIRHLLDWARKHGHHVLFAVSLVCMILLLAWWTVFISLSVRQEREYRLAQLSLLNQKWAYVLGDESERRPEEGVFERDKRFEIIVHVADQGAASQSLKPAWPQFSIRPRAEHLAQIESQYRSRRLMVIGEGTMLVCLLLVSSFVLYRLIYTELRSARQLQEFWCRVTHEIKTPITGLKAFLDTLSNQTLSQEELSELIDLAQRQVERQQVLAENILSGQRIASRASAVAPAKFSIMVFLEDWLQTSGIIRPPNKVHVTDDSGAQDCQVVADPDALRVIVDNLADNAVKYTQNTLEWVITVAQSKGKVSLAFSDNGPGFDPKLTENLFQAFRRLSPELPHGIHGTGMGLHISRQLARAMGGDLRAESKGLGHGATFLLTLKKV